MATKQIDLDEYAALLKLARIVGEYFSEIDNPAPDYAYRHSVRLRMRKAFAAARTKQSEG